MCNFILMLQSTGGAVIFNSTFLNFKSHVHTSRNIFECIFRILFLDSKFIYESIITVNVVYRHVPNQALLKFQKQLFFLILKTTETSL